MNNQYFLQILSYDNETGIITLEYNFNDELVIETFNSISELRNYNNIELIINPDSAAAAIIEMGG